MELRAQSCINRPPQPQLSNWLHIEGHRHPLSQEEYPLGQPLDESSLTPSNILHAQYVKQEDLPVPGHWLSRPRPEQRPQWLGPPRWRCPTSLLPLTERCSESQRYVLRRKRFQNDHVEGAIGSPHRVHVRAQQLFHRHPNLDPLVASEAPRRGVHGLQSRHHLLVLRRKDATSAVAKH